MKYQHQSLIFAKKLIALVCVGLFFATPVFAATEAEIQAQIEAKKQEMQQLQDKAAALQDQINATINKVNSLQSEVSLIDQQIAETTFRVDSKQAEIESLSLEMSGIQRVIDDKTAKIQDQRKSLAAAIKQLDENSRTSTLSLVLENGTFAEFFSQAQAISTLSASLRDGISTISSARAELQAKQDQLTQTKDQYQQSLLQLKVQQQSIQEQKDFKNSLLSNAKDNKQTLDGQVGDTLDAERKANEAIDALEKTLDLNEDDFTGFSSKGFIWPVRGGKISATFRDPDYFRRFGQNHMGLDLSIPQSSPVYATADGIVTGLRDNDCSTLDGGVQCPLNILSITHESPYKSRYLHLSKIFVWREKKVKQGELIGLSGGLPGTRGSGTQVINGHNYSLGSAFSTGAHLHFEMYNGGLPDDPLQYLP